MELKSLKIAKCLSIECDDSQTMVNFLQSQLDIEITTTNRIVGSHEFETCYRYNNTYISSRNDKSSAIVLGIWKFLTEEQKQILENITKAIEANNNQAILSENKSKAEKAKGGSNSYKAYKPLKEKTKELCLETLSKRPIISAMQLADQVARILEKDYIDLLENFTPYQNHKNNGDGWVKPTFYNWCNNILKSYKSK